MRWRQGGAGPLPFLYYLTRFLAQDENKTRKRLVKRNQFFPKSNQPQFCKPQRWYHSLIQKTRLYEFQWRNVGKKNRQRSRFFNFFFFFRKNEEAAATRGERESPPFRLSTSPTDRRRISRTVINTTSPSSRRARRQTTSPETARPDIVAPSLALSFQSCDRKAHRRTRVV